MRVKELCNPVNGKAFKPHEWKESGLPIVRIQNLNDTTGEYNYYQGSVLEQHQLRGGELLFAWSGTPGTSFGAHIWEGGHAVLNQHIFRLDLFFQLNKLYLKFALNCRVGSLIDVAHGGAGLQHVTKGVFESTLIPLPNLKQQIEVVKAIQTRYEYIDSLLVARRCYKRILLETPTSLRQQLVQAAIQGQLVPQNPNDEPASKLLERIAEERTAKLGKKAAKSMSRIERRGSKTYELFPDGTEKDISDDIPFDIPDSWEWCRLSYISYGLQYGTSQKSNSTGKYAVLRMGNIQNGEIDFSDLVYSNNDVDFSKLELKKGDVLFNRTNSPEWVGKTAIFRNHKTPCIFAGYLIRINQSEQIIGAYLNYFLNSSCARKQGNEVVSLAVNQANISGAKLSDYFIPIPPLQEQHRIVEKLDALLKLV